MPRKSFRSMSITSDEVNYLIYRYLVESGFNHTSFAFQYETCIHLQDKVQVQNGQLIQLLQKGLLFNQVETHLEPDGTERKCVAPFTLLGQHECQYQKKKKQKLNFSAINEKVLQGHESEVFVCSWNPIYPLIASGSGDGSCRIWSIPDDPLQESTCIVLPPIQGSGNKDVTTLDWNADGSLLATGSYDGIARIWNKNGGLKYNLTKHTGPIFSLKYNKKSDLLLSGGVDKTAVVWDVKTGEARQQFSFHTGPCLDVDWKDDLVFATSSADMKIYVCQLGSLQPLKTCTGHKDEVNSIRWDPTGQYLASCGDDKTAKIWTMDQDEPIWDLTAHGKEIYSIRWAPSREKSWLATASFDGSIRVWDIKTGSCIYTLQNHTEAVYTVDFTPDCLYLASGSFDKQVCIWSLQDGTLARKYTGSGGVFEVQYNSQGDKLGACYSDKKLICLYVGKEDISIS